MRAPLTHEDVEELEGHRSPDEHRVLAEKLLAWAEEVHPDDEPTTAELLSAAGWQHDLAGDTDGALAVFRRALAADGVTYPDVRVPMVAVLLAAGRTEEAAGAADELRRSSPGVGDCAMAAEVYELAGDLPQAHRWTAIGMTRAALLADDELDEQELARLTSARSRVRLALGMPTD